MATVSRRNALMAWRCRLANDTLYQMNRCLPRSLAATVAMASLSALVTISCSSNDGGGGPNSKSVGAICSGDQDCTRQCLKNYHYPGGMCTLPCLNDPDCVPGAVCIDEAGGVCAVVCRSDADCSAFGRGFTCNETDRIGTSPGGSVFICRKR
ncbi:MAG: hypothetical protein NVS3B20_16320 [Polyangiales bacterium]